MLSWWLRITAQLLWLSVVTAHSHFHHHNNHVDEENDQRQLGVRGKNIFSGRDEIDIDDIDINVNTEVEMLSYVKCGVPKVSPDEMAVHQAMMNSWIRDSTKDGKGRVLKSPTTVTVAVCFHVVASGDTGFVTRPELDDNLAALNRGFSSASCCDESFDWCEGECSADTGFRFAMGVLDSTTGELIEGETRESATAGDACVTYTNSRLGYVGFPNSFSDRRLLQRNRKGGLTTLNVVIRNLQRRSLTNQGGTLIGFATFPWEAVQNVERDVVYVNNLALFGQFPRLNESDTLVHEVGHWLGLYHTFEAGCSLGDLVGDTAHSASGTPPNCTAAIGRDSCPDDGLGPDPIHNFMDYTEDTCLFEFTPDQITVMHAAWNVYRLQSAGQGVIELTNGVRSEPISLVLATQQDFLLQVSSTSVSVTCQASEVDEQTGELCQENCYSGDGDLHLRWGTPAEGFGGLRITADCNSQETSQIETCTVAPASDGTTTALYATIHGYGHVIDWAIICTEE